MAQDWEIKSRSDHCHLTGKAFEDEEVFYTLLYQEKASFTRMDVCMEAFEKAQQEKPPFSFWKTRFKAPPPPTPETLPRENAESLLRRFIEEETPERARACYILALMLERKRLFRHVDSRTGSDDQKLLIYEHAKTGESFIIPDPQLKLDQIEAVQEEMTALLDQSSFKPA